MEHFQKGMKRKWERHFRQTKMTWSIIAMIASATLMFSLVFIWPQYLSKYVFNSRIAYHFIIDIEDYFTCSEGYQQFVIDEPSTDDVLFSLYVFNISNAKDVFQIGNKPQISERGPYGYKKVTYKYDVEFDTVASLTASFKEFNAIEAVEDPLVCRQFYYRMDRDFLNIAYDPCDYENCFCLDHNEIVTIINPLILKLIYEDSSQYLIAQYSKDIFTTIKQYYENEFIDAVKAHLVSFAMQEVALFRLQMMSVYLLKDAYANLKQTFNNSALEWLILYKQTATNNWQSAPCGLLPYGLNYCPLSMLFDRDQSARYLESLYITSGDDADLYILPSLIPLFDPANSRSYLNEITGLPKWLALSYQLGFLEFNPPNGYSTITSDEITNFYFDFVDYLAVQSFGTGYSYLQKRGSELLVVTIARWLGKTFVKPLSGPVFLELSLKEFWDTKDPVVCSPLSDLCVWQWGALGNKYAYTKDRAASMVTIQTKVNTNPSNFFYDLNTMKWYNSYKFCTRGAKPDIYADVELFNTYQNKRCELVDMTYSHHDGQIGQPAGMWGIDNGITAVNYTYLWTRFKNLDEDTKIQYFNLACNASYLQYKIYTESTPFHDKFVISYINKYKQDDFSHNFTVGNWSELGWAQWGGGFVTYALTGVRTVTQMLRDGFWHYGYQNYYDSLSEFSSWAIKMGYPNTVLYDVYESRALLHALADRSPEGTKFKRDIIYAGTTLIGDGSLIVNQVGEPGDVAYIAEAVKGDFSCTGRFANECALINERFTSSQDLCKAIEYLYTDCVYRKYQGVGFITNCAYFQTSISSPTLGIQCDLETVYGKRHPYTKARGNVVYSMIYALTLDLKLKNGLWCPELNGCQFEKGGMFTTTSVKQILFEGFTESSHLYYLNQKHEHQNISFRCIEDPYDDCGDTRYYCSKKGIVLHLPNGDKKNFSYGFTPNDEFFAPKLHVRTGTGELIWPYSLNSSLNKISRDIIASEPTILIHNPHWSAFPAWHDKDYDFLKFYQCAARIYQGHEGQLANCLDTVNTGRLHLNETLQMIKLHGNSSINHFPEFSMVVNGTTSQNHQYDMMQWDGIHSFQYLFNKSLNGSKIYDTKYPMRFDKRHGLHLELSQRSFTFTWEKEQMLEFPLRKTWNKRDNFTIKKSKFVYTRRFVETKESWANLQQLGTPYDSYNMPYKIPIGMASIERLAGAPMFISTPHQYGNELWGGFEYTHVRGYTPNFLSQRSFIDYEPISGKGLRNALRTQINFRVEKGPLFPNTFSSQDRCVAPTKSYSGYTGYGCFAYIPILWYEDGEAINIERLYRLEDHFLSRGDRAYTLILVGAILGSLVFIIGLIYFIEQKYSQGRFQARVYVD